MNPWTGLVAHVGRETTDGRTIERLEWEHLPIPITEAVPDGQVVGRIDTIDRRPDGSVHATGTIDRPPGRYAVGAWLRPLAGVEQEFRKHPDPHLRIEGRLVGMTVHDAEEFSAWPDVAIVVTGDPVTLEGKPDAARAVLGGVVIP